MTNIAATMVSKKATKQEAFPELRPTPFGLLDTVAKTRAGPPLPPPIFIGNA